MQSALNSLRAALVLMTTLPVRYPANILEIEKRRSVFFYPLVGAIIGLILWILAYMLPYGSMVSAGLVLSVWVILTGALHLDGLADCADAWMGGLGDRNRTLAILKDPNSGAIAVVVLILLLCLKLFAIELLIVNGHTLFLIAVPALARLFPSLLFATSAYVRKSGLGEDLRLDHKDGPIPWIVATAVSILVMILLGPSGVFIVILSSLVFFIVRSASTRRIDGFTGDVAGAGIELTEVCCCVALALWVVS
ncbi:MAG: adenosylcobinamide-GDP ribazoletransferase [bacterium]